MVDTNNIKEMLRDLLEKIKSTLEYIIKKFKNIFSSKNLEKIKYALGVVKHHLSKLASYSKEKAGRVYSKLSDAYENYRNSKEKPEESINSFADKIHESIMDFFEPKEYDTEDAGWVTYLKEHEKPAKPKKYEYDYE